MKASEMKKELESYGISTKSLLEKADFVKALQKARQDGMQPISDSSTTADKDKTREEQKDANDTTEPKSASTTNDDNTTTTTTTADATESSTVNGESSSSSSKLNRDEIFQQAMETAKAMKVGELKKELQDRGIATGTFIEKSDFVKAYANAIADDIPKKSSSSSSSSSKAKGSASKKKPAAEEPMDPSYRDVVTQKFDKRRLMGQSVIDISIR